MHELPAVANDDNDEGYLAEGNQRPLWSWLILCDDRMEATYFRFTNFANSSQILCYLSMSILDQSRMRDI